MLFFDAQSIVIWLFVGLIADYMLGEPGHYHPLVGFGRIAHAIERWLNSAKLAKNFQPVGEKTESLETKSLETEFLALKNSGLESSHAQISDASSKNTGLKFKGGIALLIAIAPFVLITTWLCTTSVDYVIQIVAIYFAVAYKSLKDHSLRVLHALNSGNIALARQNVGFIVSRNTEQMDAIGIRRACIESTLENFSDALIAPMFWFIVLGAPGVVLYRLSNTLDAMWGYKNPRFKSFGYCAAKLDDGLNYIPARITALLFLMVGKHKKEGLNSWRVFASQLPSPNGGPVMTAGAGVLNIQLGGVAYYHGERTLKPEFGGQCVPENMDVEHCLNLCRNAYLVFLLMIMISTLLFTAV